MNTTAPHARTAACVVVARSVGFQLGFACSPAGGMVAEGQAGGVMRWHGNRKLHTLEVVGGGLQTVRTATDRGVRRPTCGARGYAPGCRRSGTP